MNITRFLKLQTTMKKLLYILAAMLLPTAACAQKASSEKGMGAYLFTFFNDPTHSLFMAVSYDGYTFTAVNDGQPVIAGDSIAEQHGIRDPHIYRSPHNGMFSANSADSAPRNGKETRNTGGATTVA